MRPLMRVLAVLVVVGASLLSPVATSTPAQQAQAADARLFDPGNIINDAVFFDGRAMTAAQIQDFLRSKSPSSCPDPALDSSPCLEDFRMDTTSQAADDLCAGYQGAIGESAATIIAKVAVSCRVSPRVILVLLQKEMGFITSSNPTAKMYDRAAGYYCPDIGTGWCHPDYAGLQKQLYNAARQYQRYAANPKSYSYRSGYNNTIQWSVPKSCGTSVVYIQNQATAGLYNYTPYRPNQAALDAGYGTGNSCSAYGNRNFWLYFTDWFGSTQHATGGAVVARAQASDTRSLIGSSTGNVICGLREGGCFQPFERGAIYWSPASGARIVRGPIHERWAGMKWETGRLGYPTGEEICGLKDGGCFQDFQHGAMYRSSSTGAQPVLGSVRKKWASTQWETGYLGYPTSAEKCGLTADGCYQVFQGGRIYWSSASGAHVMVSGPVWNAWKRQGYEKSALGYPTGEQICGLRDGGCFQDFRNGAMYWTPGTGARPVVGAIRTKWASTKWETGALGYPISAEACGRVDEGCYQRFEGGSIYWSRASGAHIVTTTGVIRDKWVALDKERGSLGYPTSDQECGLRDGACAQQFQGGTLTTSVHGTYLIRGATLATWAARDAHAGTLGNPIAKTACGRTDGGCYTRFQGGSIYWSRASGTHIVSATGVIRDKWVALDKERGRLGYPTSNQECGLRDGACAQQFQGGTLTTSVHGTYLLSGAVVATWTAEGAHAGRLGNPIAATACGRTDGGCYTRFQGGSLYWSRASGTHVINATGAIRDTWVALDKERGRLGYPTSDQRCGLKQDGCFQDFQGGHLYWSPTTGAHMVSGKIFTAWGAQGWETGALGYPTGAAVTTSSTITQAFQGGTLVQNRSTGNVTRR
ncbi:hypothetical protein [Blastococcus aurantiacus]|nr:hypothetical protein [Blastococcus aurantiacus]